MKNTFTRFWALTCLLVLASASVWGQSATKATIQIRKNVNGQQETVTEEIVLDEGQTIEDILQELGLLDEFGQLLDGQAFEISIRKTDVSGGTQDIDLLFSPQAEMNQQAFLGVYLREASGEHDGALITSIIVDTSAEEVGLLEGDIIVKVDKSDIEGVQDLVTVIRSMDVGDKIKVHYVRDGKKKKDNVLLGERTPEGVEQFFVRGTEPNAPCSPEHLFQDCDKLQFFNDTVIFAPFEMEGNSFEIEMEEGPFLGVSPSTNLDASIAGIKIGRVIEGSSAEEMGLVIGDHIQSFNGTVVNDFDALAELIEATVPGQVISMEVHHGGKVETIEGTIGSREYRNNQNFRIFHDLKGMDENGNLFYNYDFEFDASELEKCAEQLELHLGELSENIHIIESLEGLEQLEALEGLEWTELQELINHEVAEATEMANGIVEEINISINITDITAAEAEAINANAEVPLRLEQDLEMEQISFFPNPTIGEINLAFETPSSDPVQLDILLYDQNGATIYRETQTGFTGSYEGVIDISDEASGTYYLQIVCGEKSFSRKVVKKS